MSSGSNGSFVIRPYEPRDQVEVLAVNESCMPEVGPMDADKLDRFASWNSFIRVLESNAGAASSIVGMMVGFNAGVPYESPNYGWFAQRYSSFAYVDRIALLPEARGNGWGPRFYVEFSRWAAENGSSMLCAEVNTVPPNPRSIAFHESFGFDAIEEFAPRGTEDYKVMMFTATL